MSKNALLVIQIFDSIAASAKALQDLPADQDGVDIVALIQHAARLGPLLEFHVCFYTALTLFRSPQMSDAGGALKAKLYGNLQVALTKISRLRFADGSGPPKHAEALLSEMCAFAALLICRRPDAFVPSSCCVCVCDIAFRGIVSCVSSCAPHRRPPLVECPRVCRPNARMTLH